MKDEMGVERCSRDAESRFGARAALQRPYLHLDPMKAALMCRA
jgi:hypothetical protein